MIKTKPMTQNIKSNKWWNNLNPLNPIWFFMEIRSFMQGYHWYKVYPVMPIKYIGYLINMIRG